MSPCSGSGRWATEPGLTAHRCIMNSRHSQYQLEVDWPPHYGNVTLSLWSEDWLEHVHLQPLPQITPDEWVAAKRGSSHWNPQTPPSAIDEELLRCFFCEKNLDPTCFFLRKETFSPNEISLQKNQDTSTNIHNRINCLEINQQKLLYIYIRSIVKRTTEFQIFLSRCDAHYC